MGRKVNELGQALKTALTVEVYSDTDKVNCQMLPAVLLMQGFISKELAWQMKYAFFMSSFYTVSDDSIHEEAYEAYFCEQIRRDHVFRNKCGLLEPEEVYHALNKYCENWEIADPWFFTLNKYAPNLVVKGDYLYVVAPESGLYRIEKERLKDGLNNPNALENYETLEGMPYITDIEGFNEHCLYARDERHDYCYYSYDFAEGKTTEHEGFLHGICGGVPIVEKDGFIFAYENAKRRVLLEEGNSKSIIVRPDCVIVNCNKDSIDDIPYYFDCRDWRTKCLDYDDMTSILWEYIVRRLYSLKNKTEDTFHMKNHPSMMRHGTFYGPWQLAPPIMTTGKISNKILEMVGHRDNRNVQLFLEVLKYVDQYEEERTVTELLWDHIWQDKGEKTEGAVFSEEYVRSLLGKTVQGVQLNENKMKGNLDKHIHEMKLHPSPFDKIRARIKTIELRMYDEKRQKIKIYDDIIFTNDETGEELGATVVGLYIFPNFETLFAKLPLLKCGYTAKNVLSASPADMNKYYSEEIRNRYNVVGIELHLKNVNEIKNDKVNRLIDIKHEENALALNDKEYGMH